MSTISSYVDAMRNYAVFSGRTGRAQFWAFFNVYFVLTISAMIVDHQIEPSVEPPNGVLTLLVQLVHLLPGFAVMVRRLHDLDRTGWWALLGLTGLGWIVLLVMGNPTGAPGPNRFGLAPAGAAVGGPAGALGGADHAQAASQAARDPIAEVERLAALRASGSLTETEFEVMKARALGQPRAGA